jgi:hypothetical protein
MSEIFSNPDDPYTTTLRWDNDGLHVIVSADALGEDPEIRAECTRRANLIRDWLANVMYRR